MTFKVTYLPASLSYACTKYLDTILIPVHQCLLGYTQMVWHNVLQRPADEYHAARESANLRKAIRDHKLHIYVIAHIVYRRKPA